MLALSLQDVVAMTYSIVFLQAGVRGEVVAEYVFRREYRELYRQRDSSSSHITGNKKACVSVRL